jgi:hypothetical protein
MTRLMIEESFDHSDPLDVIEQVAGARDWSFERAGDGEIAVSISGQWSDYHLTFSWREDLETLHLACTFDLRAAERQRPDIYALLGLLNERLWLGHFDLWSEDGTILFRHTLPLSGVSGVSHAQCEDLLDMAIDACERFYPAFQFVVWAGKSPEEAIAAAMFDTEGEA